MTLASWRSRSSPRPTKQAPADRDATVSSTATLPPWSSNPDPVRPERRRPPRVPGVGTGPLDILFVDTWVHHVEAVWDFPDFARCPAPASFGRLIHFDRRGTGLSDPVPLDRLPDFDTQVEDVTRSWMRPESERPAIIGANDGTLVAMLLAAAHPARCRSLVLFAPTAKHEPASGQPEVEEVVQLITRSPEDSGMECSRRAGSATTRSKPVAPPAAQLRTPEREGHYYRQTMESDVHDSSRRSRARRSS